MEKKHNVYISIVIIVLIIVGIGSTFAYFTSTIRKEREENAQTKVMTEAIANATMDLGDLVTANNILPGHKIIKTITVTGEGGEKAKAIKATITLTPEVEEFKNHVKYSLYEVESIKAPNPVNICGTSNPVTKDGEYYDNMECITNGLGSPIIEGIFVGKEPVNHEIEVNGTTKKTYYLLIEYINDKETSQDDEQGKTFTVTIGFGRGKEYKEALLKGADPVLAENLIPIEIDEQGKVRKADIEGKWYSYEEKKWANAVILVDKTKSYNSYDVIPEENIESYFVWIPKYSYQLWDMGNYNSLTNTDITRIHTIPIKFGLEDTIDANEFECSTPMTSGSNGNCQIGDYMTHPAFISMNTNGLWVGKFETGYKDAASTAGAEVNSSDASKVVIKPNVYSWRNINVANAFGTSYEYQRELDSHMMKNTEWGAVAYLQHSAYGSRASVRINNNRAYITGYAATIEPTTGYNGYKYYESTSLGIDGANTYNYFNPLSVVASTTGNYSGIYDMSGGSWEYVMGVMLNQTNTAPLSGNSGFTTFPEAKYYDAYLYDTSMTTYNRGILGDATKEMGPFGSNSYGTAGTRNIGSWYNDESWYVSYSSNASSSSAWFMRGAYNIHGMGSGLFCFSRDGTINGKASSYISFRLVLAI